MTHILELLLKKKLQFFFLFYIVLLLPVLSPIAENLDTINILLLITINVFLFVGIYITLLFVSPRWERCIYSLLFIVAYLPGSIYISYLLFAHVLLQGNSIISLFETNPEESKEFLAHYFNPWLIVGFAAYIFICFFVIWKMKSVTRMKIVEHRRLFFSGIAIVAIIISIPIFSQSVYFIDFYKLFINYKIRIKKESEAIHIRQSIPYEVTNTESENSKTIVLVIGESLTRRHMSLYGYPRETNPKLASMGDSLLVYKDVLSPQVHTIPVLRSVMTMADNANPEYLTDKTSLVELFNRAGYETNFISTQPFEGHFKTSYDVFLDLAQYQCDLSSEKQPDEIILPKLRKILEDSNKKQNKLIIIHLIGNHMAYEFRYTLPYNVFDNSKDKLISTTPFRDSKAKHTIDKYDNSVLYNDHLIYEMIHMLQNQEENSALVYFSDHGEEVYDIRDFSGHAYEKVSTYMCEIPFLVWLSPTYRDKRFDLDFDISRPYSTQDVIFSLSDLAGLNYKDYDDTKSVFSKKFEPRERYIGSLTYDEVKAIEAKYK